MSIRTWIRTPRVRRGLAAGAVVLALGGLVLARAPAGAQVLPGVVAAVTPSGLNTTSFSGPGAHGTFSLSHTKVLSGSEQRVFAELVLKADPAEQARERAPLSMVIVLDTSGSMAGEKIDQAKRSVLELIRDLRDDDEIAVVRYSTESEIVQPLARAGRVRADLLAKVEGLSAGGGTNIAPALSQGVRVLAEAGRGRVRRIILASDGLDGTRARSEAVARECATSGITVSSMGIGLDFDESYMGGVAQAGHGNFVFVKDASALASFLQRELKETATTTVERATARITLPPGVRFLRAAGADARSLGAADRLGSASAGASNEIELSIGSLFAGDERRIVLELAADLDPDITGAIAGQVRWDRIGGDNAQARIDGLSLVGSVDNKAVEAGRDPSVYASAMSVIASRRQLEAAQAYQQGDARRAQALIDQNVVELHAAAAAAPPPAATAIWNQVQAYENTKKVFAVAKPKSAEGNAAAKAATQKDLDNMGRAAAF